MFILFLLQVIGLQLRDRCSCENLNMEDCQLVQWCQWNSTKCQIKIPTVIQNNDQFHSLYCNSHTEPECQLLEQCAFIRGSCQAFAGCTAYEYSNTTKCENISKLCTEDAKSKVCMSKQCTQAPYTYTTDEECKGFKLRCITNGQGCTDQLLECKAYTSDPSDPSDPSTEKDCNKMIGNNGFCSKLLFVSLPQICDRIQCSGNITAIQTQGGLKYELVINQQEKSLGKPKQTCNLDKCEQVTGDYYTCMQYTDSYGNPCWIDNISCRVKKCSDIINPQNIDQCYLNNQHCVFDGVQCQQELKTCKDYKTDCIKRITKEGYCIMGQSGSCQALVCDLIPINKDCTTKHNQCQLLEMCSYITVDCIGHTPEKCKTDSFCEYQNNQCNEVYNSCWEITTSQACYPYSHNCKWNQFCGTTQSCSAAKTQLECKLTKQLNDLNCIWMNQCQEPNNCQQATSRVKLNDQCKIFGENCIANGTSCTLREYSCNEYPQDLCDKSISMLGKCQWVVDGCKEKECEDNINCNQMKNCYHDGITCRSGLPNCSDYKVKETCYLDTQGRACLWKETANPPCQSQNICEDIFGVSTFEACQQYSPDCVISGHQCMPIQFCGQYTTLSLCIKGIDGKCGIIIEKNGNQLCRSTQSKQCSDSQGITSQQCQLWMSHCTSDGTGCVDKQSKCEAYLTEQSCSVSITTSFQYCKYDTKCRPMQCEDLGVPKCTSTSLYSEKNAPLQETCIPISNEERERCMTMLLSCSMYKQEAECVATITNTKCVWKSLSKVTGGVCQVLTKCEDIANQKTCDSISDKCYWEDNKCLNLTCHANYMIFQQCESLQLFEGQTVKCQLIDFGVDKQQCKETPMTNLDCLNISQLTKYYFSGNCIPCQVQGYECKYNQRPLSAKAREQMLKDNQQMRVIAQIVLSLLILII